MEVGVGSGGGRRANIHEGKLADLMAGTLVSLALSADQKAVESILAEGPTVRGQMKGVDLVKNTLTVAVPPTRRDPRRAADARRKDLFPGPRRRGRRR